MKTINAMHANFLKFCFGAGVVVLVLVLVFVCWFGSFILHFCEAKFLDEEV